MISNCGHDENNKYTNGRAGDQTGNEWRICNWYSRPWTCVIRHPSSKVRAIIADLAKKAALNDNIGYDQNQRYTYWEQLKANAYDPSSIKTPCEADCSSGVAANVKAAGYLLNIEELKRTSIYLCTSNMRAALANSGFQVLTDPRYLTSAEYLLAGDILLCEGHHVATNLDPSPSEQKEIDEPHWVNDGSGNWYYRIAPGQNAHGFRVINHHRYYFDETGKMLKDWFQVNENWYYGQPNGSLEGAIYTSNEDGVQTIKYYE